MSTSCMIANWFNLTIGEHVGNVRLGSTNWNSILRPLPYTARITV